jgi:hypothetical protein
MGSIRVVGNFASRKKPGKNGEGCEANPVVTGSIQEFPAPYRVESEPEYI